jgi:arginyl-tRNA synthetase
VSVRPPLEAIGSALTEAVARLGVPEQPQLELGRARNPAHGDYSSSVAMKLARALRRPPAAIAEGLAAQLRDLPEASVEAVGGYLNFRLRPGWLRGLVPQVACDEAYGACRLGDGERVQVEFVSANPTGPLHIGHGRGAILGDTLSRLLTFTGHDVEREYYVNDQNTQARNFGASVYARLHGQEPPEGGYGGAYVAELATEASSALPGIRSQPFEEAEPRLRRFAIERMVGRLQATMARLRVEYDRWFWESSLWEEGLPQEAIERLRAGGHLAEREGALWFSPAIADWEQEDEDRVVIRSSGEPTYFASDLGYLLSKFERRGFRRVIDVWGADHHGYVPRIRGAMAALGLDPQALVVILNQMVNLKEGKMSKRQGRFVTIDELVDRVGTDAVRYFYLLRSPDAMMDFDLDLAVSEGNENPVYYAQYAHARLANVEPTAAQAHRSLPERPDMDLIDEPWELALARQLAYWPEAVETAARRLEPHRLPYYVHELAERVHAFYHAGNDEPAHRVVVADAALTRARLELCRAARNTLKIALGLMGVTAPQRM